MVFFCLYDLCWFNSVRKGKCMFRFKSFQVFKKKEWKYAKIKKSKEKILKQFPSIYIENRMGFSQWF